MGRARALVFDFDGTLIASNAIKHRAFERCFADAPAARQAEIQAYCRGAHHTPRWEKFRHVYERILRQPYTAAREAELLSRFDAETTRQIMAAPDIPGASRWLAAVSRTHATALLSSTPHEVLLTIVAGRGWRGHFQTVQGAPVNKASWLRQWRERYPGEGELLFFGDTPEDRQAARDADCAFIGVANPDLHGTGTAWIADFTTWPPVGAGAAEPALPPRTPMTSLYL